MENFLVVERLNDSVENFTKQINVSHRLEIILKFAIGITIGTIFFHFLENEGLDVFDFLGHIDESDISNFVLLIFLSVVSLCFILSHIILFVLAYIIYAIDVSLHIVKPEYQVPRYQTLFIQWGYILLGVLNLIVLFADGDWEVLIIGGWSVVLVMGVIWTYNLSKKWSKLGSEHKKLADSFRNYAYLQIVLFVMTAIGIVGLDWLEIINGAINLYLFIYLILTYNKMVDACSTAPCSTCADNLTWKIHKTTLTISGIGNMTPNYRPWHGNRKTIKKVVINEGVTSIGDWVFYDCSNLISITIPNSVTSIGDNAFNGCSSLTSVAIPNSVTSIGKSAFFMCDNLTSITIPNSVTSIGDWAFWGCFSLTSVTCYAMTPPNAFKNAFNPNVMLYVPADALDAYKANEEWKNCFADIRSEETRWR